MDASSIKPANAKRIGKALQAGLDYLRRLRERLGAVGFQPDDPLQYDTVPQMASTFDPAGPAERAWIWAAR